MKRSISVDSSSPKNVFNPETPNGFDDSVYLNFTSMHSIQPILSRIRELAAITIPKERVPRLCWFKQLLELQAPPEMQRNELPFSVYLISGNAGSGKSTCIQTLNEAIDCIITGSTRVAAQNVHAKLSTAYASRPINTIFHEFGFRGNHIQAQLGRYAYNWTTTPPSIEDLQKRDIVYYWEVLIDITKRVFQMGDDGRGGTSTFKTLWAIERLLNKPTGSMSGTAFIACGSLPAFTRSNVIVIDEAGLLGRHILTAVVYCWWLLNAIYQSPQYINGRKPVIVCVGSPTQTDSLESHFQHDMQRSHVTPSENILTYIICNQTLRQYTNISHNWAIFINNKRCQEDDFGNLLKTLEYGLPITEAHARLVDTFVVPASYINNPANLPGWTRLYSSHKEVSAYMSKLHAHLKLSKNDHFSVFALPTYTFIRLTAFDEYRKLTGQPGLSVEHWIRANSGRLHNYSQSRDHDMGTVKYETHSNRDLIVARTDITYVLNSLVVVTTRLRKLVIGFSGTFQSFAKVLRDDSFVKAQGETSIEYAYRFLSNLIFGGLINFYNFLLNKNLHPDKVSLAYKRLAALTLELLSGTNKAPLHEAAVNGAGAGIDCDGAATSADKAFCFTKAPESKVTASIPEDPDDVIFTALNDEVIDLVYCQYEFSYPKSSNEVHAQFLLMKAIYDGRYAILAELFESSFTTAPFSAYVDNVNFNGSELLIGNVRGGLLSLALQTDTYTLLGYTFAPVPVFVEELTRKKLYRETTEMLYALHVPLMVLQDQHGFVSIVNANVCEFTESIEDAELAMATTVDYGLSSKLAMTIARSQGLSLEKVAICFTADKLRLNSVYVAMSRTVSSRFLKMNLNPLRERYEKSAEISDHILAALRDPNVHVVY
nr:primase [Human alphaherpesvirus 3]